MAAAKRNWDLSKLPTDIRSLAEEAANKAGIPVNDWLKEIVQRQSAAEREERIDERREALKSRAEELARNVTIMPNQATPSPEAVPHQPQADAAAKVTIVGVTGGGALAAKLTPTVAAPGAPEASAPDARAQSIAHLNDTLTTVARYLGDGAGAPTAIALSSMGPNSFQNAPEANDPDVLALKEWLRGRPSVPPLILQAAQDDVESYEVVAGLAHWRAAEEIGLPSLDAIIVSPDERETVKLVLIATLCDDRISPIEEAESYRWLLRHTTVGEDDLMKITGRRRQHIRDVLALLTLSEPIQKMIETGRLGTDQAHALFDARFAEAVAKAVVDHRLDVAQTKELVRLTDEIDTAGTDFSNALQERVDNLLGTQAPMEKTTQRFRIRLKNPNPQQTPPTGEDEQ